MQTSTQVFTLKAARNLDDSITKILKTISDSLVLTDVKVNIYLGVDTQLAAITAKLTDGVRDHNTLNGIKFKLRRAIRRANNDNKIDDLMVEVSAHESSIKFLNGLIDKAARAVRDDEKSRRRRAYGLDDDAVTVFSPLDDDKVRGYFERASTLRATADAGNVVVDHQLTIDTVITQDEMDTFRATSAELSKHLTTAKDALTLANLSIKISVELTDIEKATLKKHFLL